MDSMTFVLFGATGDLAKRKIYPALFNLYLDNKLPETFNIIGVGKESLSPAEFQSKIIDSLYTFSRHLLHDKTKKETFAGNFHYYQLDAANSADYKGLLELVQENEKALNMQENRLYYLSVAPELFEVIASNIKESGLGDVNGWKRLIIEKPFGHDLKSAQRLNKNLSYSFDENEIYRIDHYLGKPMVQNLEALVLANPILQSLWNNQSIANVQITASEIVGVEERAGYYDKSGAIRDMVQNHMLQLLMMTTMHLPSQLTRKTIRNEKRKVLEALRPLKKTDAGNHVVRGQYEHGIINQKPVFAYREEAGVSKSSLNDTFFAARLWIDNHLWKGVPFYIRTGKRMAEKATKIVIEFKHHSPDPRTPKGKQIEPNLLTIYINPNEGVSLQLNSKNPSNGELEPIKVNFASDNLDVPEAYERLLSDALYGDATFFAHWDEVELSWKWIDPILEAFKENKVPLQPYSSGSTGPESAHHLLQKDGYRWW